MRDISPKGTLWELAVLSLLREEPMHPYQMQRLLRDRHQDEVLGLKPGSLYHAINRLVRAGFIEAVTIERAGRRPERTVYRLKPEGARAFARWLRERLASPPEEVSEFAGSVSFLVHLTPKEALAQLESRAAALEATVQGVTAVQDRAGRSVPRVHLVEKEYLLAIRRAELTWLRGLIGDLRAGRLAWDPRQVLAEVRAARRRAGGPTKGATT
jgi:DNA-binding PadR family transcriptional regulator